MLTHAAYHFNSSVQRVTDRGQVSRGLEKKRGVRDEIKYT